MPSSFGVAQEVYEDQAAAYASASLGGGIDVIQVLGGGAVLQGYTLGGLTYGSKIMQDNITAKAGGGQNTGPLVTGSGMRITTVVNSGDSVQLPPALPGYAIVIVNDASANPANVFPASGEQINTNGLNAAFSLATGTPTIFYCFTKGAWRTK